jgi:hypothetical protein
VGLCAKTVPFRALRQTSEYSRKVNCAWSAVARPARRGFQSVRCFRRKHDSAVANVAPRRRTGNQRRVCPPAWAAQPRSSVLLANRGLQSVHCVRRRSAALLERSCRGGVQGVACLQRSSVSESLAVLPNPSLHPKCYSGLRPLSHSGELKRWASLWGNAQPREDPTSPRWRSRRPRSSMRPWESPLEPLSRAR